MLWYGHHNKTEAPIDALLKWQIAGWVLLYVILVWFVATSRRKKFQSLAVGTLALSSGALLSIGVHDVNWLTGSGQVSGSYSRWTEMKHGHQEMLIPARISVHIGLSEMNVTLKSYDPRMKFYYNEHLYLQPRTRWERLQYNSALYKGLPNPILSVLDFFIHNDCYFKFTQIGFMTRYMLSGCCIIWAVNLVILLMVPEISAKVGFLNSLLIFITTLKYMTGVNVNFYFFVEGRDIHVAFGRSVFMVLASALLQAIPAFLVYLNLYPRTSFEVDFDSPWDREELAKCSNTSKKEVKPRIVQDDSIFSGLKSACAEVKSNQKDIVITMEGADKMADHPKNDASAHGSALDMGPSNQLTKVEIENKGKPTDSNKEASQDTKIGRFTTSSVQNEAPRRSTEEMLEELRAKIKPNRPKDDRLYGKQNLSQPQSIMSLLRSGRKRSVSTWFTTASRKSSDMPPVTKEQILRATYSGLRSAAPRTEVRRRSPTPGSEVRRRSPTPATEFRRRSPARTRTAEPTTNAQFKRNLHLL